MRSAPAAPTTVAWRTDGIRSESRTYKFLTPVFGGGFDPRKPDPVTPVRVPSIRGQLRFWWRACNPRGCTSVAELRRAEASVFGSTASGSPLSIAVMGKPPAARPLEVMEDGDNFKTMPGMQELAYAAFPLRDSTGAKRHGRLSDYGDQTFTLALTFPEAIAHDVEAALWAWGHLGSLGGRTRRGFGAIAQVSSELPSLTEAWPRYVSGRPVAWPHLSTDPEKSCVVAPRPVPSGLEAQKVLIGLLRKLRQGELGRKRARDRMPGRSLWPEPNTLRHLLKQGDPRHKDDGPAGPARGFPRAAFGLPLIFHFKSNEVDESTLQPLGSSRWASPLLLRPHQRPDGRVEPMAVVLAGPRPAAYELLVKGRPRAVSASETVLAASVAATVAPLNSNGRTFTDPILRYLEELKK